MADFMYIWFTEQKIFGYRTTTCAFGTNTVIVVHIIKCRYLTYQTESRHPILHQLETFRSPKVDLLKRGKILHFIEFQELLTNFSLQTVFLIMHNTCWNDGPTCTIKKSYYKRKSQHISIDIIHFVLDNCEISLYHRCDWKTVAGRPELNSK